MNGVEALLRLRVFQPHCHMIVKHQNFQVAMNTSSMTNHSHNSVGMLLGFCPNIKVGFEFLSGFGSVAAGMNSR